MNVPLLSSLAVVALLLILELTHLIVRLTFPDSKGLYHCPRWVKLRGFITWLQWTRPLRKLAEAIRVGMAFLMAPSAQIVVFAPEESWELLQETLEMDAKSHAFDQELRRKIRTALARLTVL